MFSRHIFVESADYCAGLAGNFPDASTGRIQQKLFDLLGIMIHCPMGGVPPSHNTVILLCAISFLLNHDPDLRIFSEIAGGLFHFKKDNAQYSLKPQDYDTLCDQAPIRRLEGRQPDFWRLR